MLRCFSGSYRFLLFDGLGIYRRGEEDVGESTPRINMLPLLWHFGFAKDLVEKALLPKSRSKVSTTWAHDAKFR